MSGVVRAHEEVAAGPGQTIDAGCKHGAHRFVIPALPRGHAVLEGDAVHGDIRMRRMPETVAVLTDLAPAQRGTFSCGPGFRRVSSLYPLCPAPVVALRVTSGRATTAVIDQDPDDDPVSISCVMTATRTSARNIAAEPIRLPLLFGVPIHAQASADCPALQCVSLHPPAGADIRQLPPRTVGDRRHSRGAPSSAGFPVPDPGGCTVFDRRPQLIVISGDYDDQYAHSITDEIKLFLLRSSLRKATSCVFYPVHSVPYRFVSSQSHCLIT